MRRTARSAFAVIGGVPEDLDADEHDYLDYEALLSDPRMQPRVDPSDASRLLAACESAQHGRGAPARRLVDAARELRSAGPETSVVSICADDYSSAISPITVSLRWGWGECVVRPNDTCELDVLLPAGASCDIVPGASYVRDEGERVVCTLPETAPSAEERAARTLPPGPGWVFDDYTREAEWACASSDADVHWGLVTILPTPTRFLGARLRCLVSLAPPAPLGTFCAPGSSPSVNPCPWLPGGPECDPYSRTCGVPCTSDDDCAEQLPGYVCDLHPLESLDPERFAGDARPRGFCVSATCE